MAPTSKFQLILLATIIGVATGWYLGGRSNVPDTQWVNGTYRNPCCAAVVLRDGMIITSGMRVSFTLEHMKFGMTAYPEKPVEVDGNRVVAQPADATTAISFSENLSSFTLRCRRNCAGEYVFSRF